MELSRDATGPCLVPGGSVLTIGAFDGLHLGHRALLARVRERAAALDCAPAAVSFEPLPRAFFASEPLPRLASRQEKVAGFRGAGLAQVLLLRFNAALRALPAEDFVRGIVAGRMGAREVHVGADFRFGHRRRGDVDLLARMGEELGFRVATLPEVTVGGERVSSSTIRGHLAAGEFAAAARLLGRPFAMSGRVVHGNKLGRELGYPTANIPLGSRTSPVHGIFAVRARLAGDAAILHGVASLGTRPTVHALAEPLLEVHLFDFDADIYGRRLEVEFVAHLRDEAKFADLEALVAQMDRDAEAARARLVRA